MTPTPQTNTPDAPPPLLDQVRAAMPDLDWEESRYADGVRTNDLPRRRWMSVTQGKDGTYSATVSRWVRETPSADGDVDRFSATRTRRGSDLAALLAEAVADPLDPVTVAGLVLWPNDYFGSGKLIDDSGRYMFQQNDHGWRWDARHPAAASVSRLFVSFGRDLGGQSQTLPEAVADAIDAPRRLAALIEVLAADLAREAPPADPWTYAGVIVAKDGERAFVGPLPALLDLKDQMRKAEGPFIGRMDTDASTIVAVPVDQSAGLEAAAMIEHPAAIRLKRY